MLLLFIIKIITHSFLAFFSYFLKCYFSSTLRLSLLVFSFFGLYISLFFLFISKVIMHSFLSLFCISVTRPVIKENTARVVANCQNSILLWHEISMKLNIGQKIIGLQIMPLNNKKSLACFQIYRTDV